VWVAVKKQSSFILVGEPLGKRAKNFFPYVWSAGQKMKKLLAL